MKKIEMIKNGIYVILGILILIFNRFCLNHIALTISVIMVLNALEDIIYWSIKGLYKEGTRFFEALILFILVLVLILVRNDFEKCLIIFGVWMILEEGKEITHCVERIIDKKYAFVDLLESLFIVVMSVLLIISPNTHHAHIHIFILGAELLTEVMFYYIYKLIDSKKKKEEINEK